MDKSLVLYAACCNTFSQKMKRLLAFFNIFVQLCPSSYYYPLCYIVSMHYFFVLICMYSGAELAFCNLSLLSFLNIRVLSAYYDVIYPLKAACGCLRWSCQVIKNFEIILVWFLVVQSFFNYY